jgi:predicted transcriptional regulator of viral defense system
MVRLTSLRSVEAAKPLCFCSTRLFVFFSFSVKDTHLIFGVTPSWHGRIKVQVSDVHRTMIDMLDEPAAGGGIRHVNDCLIAYFGRPDADTTKLVTYAERIGNGAIFKRLGFLAERIDGPENLIRACAERLTSGNVRLDPALESVRLVRRWRLWVSDSWKRKLDQAHRP